MRHLAERTMAISDIPVLSILRNRMQWHQERQRVLSENVANSDTPGFKPKDLVEPDSYLSSPSTSAATSLTRTDPAHIALSASSTVGSAAQKNDYETRPTGNSVSLEDEMMKVAQNQMDYQAAASLYTKSLGLLKTALGH
jgi:flagellar basal-body rod protein FlgB